MDAEYLATVEAAFLQVSGRGLMLSARDVELVGRWCRAGVPVKVVCAGVAAAFDRPPRRPVRSLAYTSRAVEEAIRAWRARGVGGSVGEVGPARSVADEVEAAATRHGGHLAELCARAAEGLRAGRDPDALADGLCEAFLETLDTAERAALERAVDARVVGGDDLTPAIRRELRQAQRWRLVRERLGLPSFVAAPGGRW